MFTKTSSKRKEKKKGNLRKHLSIFYIWPSEYMSFRVFKEGSRGKCMKFPRASPASGQGRSQHWSMERGGAYELPLEKHILCLHNMGSINID